MLIMNITSTWKEQVEKTHIVFIYRSFGAKKSVKCTLSVSIF